MKPNKLSYPLLLTAAFTFSLYAIAHQERHESTEAKIYTEDVETHPSQGDVRVIEGGKATLLTTPNGAWASLNTRELTPGNAYTLWFVAIANPAACENSPCKGSDVLKLSDRTHSDVGYGGGLIAGPDGTGDFVTYRPVGVLPQAWLGNGFKNPQTAEIHLVVHDHGPLVDGMEQTMISTYRGGCTDDSLPESAPATARNDGDPGPNTCKLVQDVVFPQSES